MAVPAAILYWTPSGTGAGERLHVIGKGILRFHAVYWPAMLLAAGLPLPTTVFVHGYLTSEGQKIGKSLGNAVDPQALIARYGPDTLRWYLLREVPATADADFSVARLLARYNADLAHDLGNLLHRTNSMLHRYRGGRLPAAEGRDVPVVAELVAIAEALPERLAAAMQAGDPRAAIEAVWALVVRANRAVDEIKPWALYRAEAAGDLAARQALDTLLYALLEAVRLVAVHLQPFVPGASARMLAALSGPEVPQPYAQQVRWGGLRAGTQSATPAVLFPLLE